ncbi:MAG: molybdate ABC transporter substrate-binding protein [Campylobacterales bacterium]|nr:molybdate ABC transporter substrate-binding protein [Campylobacterales bacterium]
MKKLLLVFTLTSILFGETINIAVATNVSYAIKDLIKEFNKEHPQIKVRVTLGSSGKLTAQIKNGAPYHLFMSANMDYPNALFNEGKATLKPVVYAKGSLAILSSKDLDFSKGVDLVKDVKRIAVASPKTAPYGKASVEAMKNAKVYDKSKLIYGESISQTVSFTIAAADIGFVAKSALYSPKMKRFQNKWVEVDPKLYTPISQGVVLLDKEAKPFYDFILSSKAKAIFRDFGYITE